MQCIFCVLIKLMLLSTWLFVFSHIILNDVLVDMCLFRFILMFCFSRIHQWCQFIFKMLFITVLRSLARGCIKSY